ncbi:MAG: hypothetical protein ACRC92_25475 [Peptostreptococcaceae bacterium]
MAQTTSYVTASPNVVNAELLPGYAFETDLQTLDIDPIYTNSTPITVPYTGNAVPYLTSGFVVSITSGTNARTLASADYTATLPTAGELLVDIDANIFSAADLNGSGFVNLTIEFLYERTI